jgi:hypothetical protein
VFQIVVTKALSTSSECRRSTGRLVGVVRVVAAFHLAGNALKEVESLLDLLQLKARRRLPWAVGPMRPPLEIADRDVIHRLRPPERNAEEEPQRRHRDGVGAGRQAGLTKLQLVATDILEIEQIGTPLTVSTA